jgi:hypothetical protein
MLLLAAALPFLASCGNAVECAIGGDNFQGRVTFASGVTIRSDAKVIVQASTDSFSTNVLGSASEDNIQGLVTISFGLCLETNRDFQFRAFQDLNGNGSPDAGESSGRDDGTDTGDAAFVSRNSPRDAQGKVTRIEDMSITIDNP